MDLQRIIDHYIKARVKHPTFCDKFIVSSEKTMKSLLLKTARDVCEKFPTAQTILGEEVAEIYDAYANGEKEHAIDECYDAIAVLLRMIEFIENE